MLDSIDTFSVKTEENTVCISQILNHLFQQYSHLNICDNLGISAHKYIKALY